MKKVFHQIHLWLSVPFGLIISLICFSGAMLVFETEVMEFALHDLYYVKRTQTTALPINRLLAKAAAALPDSAYVAGLVISSDPERAYQANLSHPRRVSIYIDQYTGEVKGKYGRSAFFMAMFRLHRWLLDSMKTNGGIFWGRMIVGTSTLFFIGVLVSGIVIWWPRTKKELKSRLKISTGKGLKRFWYDLHVVGGVYAVIFLLVMAFTGLTWSFGWYRTGFYKVFGAEVQKRSGHSTSPQAAKGNEHPFLPYAYWQKVYEQLTEKNPGYKEIALSDGAAHVSFSGFGNQRASDYYKFNPRNGEISEHILYKDSGRAGKIRGWIYSVHVGSWGGMFTRLLSFIAALIGATLPLTGYYLWIKRTWRKKSKKQV